MNSHMIISSASVGKLSATYWTSMLLNTFMNLPYMSLDLRFCSELFTTNMTCEWFLPRMNTHMSHICAPTEQILSTDLTLKVCLAIDFNFCT